MVPHRGAPWPEATGAASLAALAVAAGSIGSGFEVAWALRRRNGSFGGSSFGGGMGSFGGSMGGFGGSGMSFGGSMGSLGGRPGWPRRRSGLRGARFGGGSSGQGQFNTGQQVFRPQLAGK